MNTNTFPTTVGVEYSFCLPRIDAEFGLIGSKRYEDIDIEGRCSMLKHPNLDYYEYEHNEKALRAVAKYVMKHVHVDDGAIEIGSPVFKCEKDVEKFYETLIQHMKTFGLMTHYSREIDGVMHYNSTGGGHVHLGLNVIDESIKKAFVENIVAHGLNSPWMGWLFNEWMDDCLNPDFLIQRYNYAIKSAAYDFSTITNPLAQLYTHDRFTPVAARLTGGTKRGDKAPETLEFRIFNAPADVTESLLHIKFALAYFSYIKKITEAGKVVPVNLFRYRSTAHFKDEGRFLYHVHKLFDLIELNFAPYERFVENYRLRRDYGTL